MIDRWRQPPAGGRRRRQSLIGIVTRADLVRAFVRSDADGRAARSARTCSAARCWIEPGEVEVEVHRRRGAARRARSRRRADAELIPRFVQRVPGVRRVLSKLRWREDGAGASRQLLEQALVDRVAHELGAGRQPELLHDVRPVRLGRAHRDVEHLRDLLVRVAEREQPQHLALALRERVGLLARLRLGLGRDQPRAERRDGRSGRRPRPPAPRRRPRRRPPPSGRSRSRPRRTPRARSAGRPASRAQHLRLRRLLEHERHALDPALAGHDDVHQDDVGLLRARLEDGRRGRRRPRRRPRCRPRRRAARCRPERTTAWSSTIRTRIVVIRSRGHLDHDRRARLPRVDSTASLPPSSPTRSLIPTRPSPSPRRRPAPKPRPSSSITARHRAVAPGDDDADGGRARACLTTFVSASWTIR